MLSAAVNMVGTVLAETVEEVIVEEATGGVVSAIARLGKPVVVVALAGVAVVGTVQVGKWAVTKLFGNKTETAPKTETETPNTDDDAGK